MPNGIQAHEGLIAACLGFCAAVISRVTGIIPRSNKLLFAALDTQLREHMKTDGDTQTRILGGIDRLEEGLAEHRKYVEGQFEHIHDRLLTLERRK